MNSDSNNPWAERFVLFLDKKIIKERALVTVPRLVGLREMPVELACKRLEDALKTVFYPTTQCVEILYRLVGVAYAHCITTYSDSKAFLTGVYAKESPLSEFCSGILLTGLAGTGKTEIMKALLRILAEDGQIIIEGINSPVPLRRPWRVAIHVRSNPKDILKALAQSDGTPTVLADKCRKLVFRDGIPLLMADEFQFATGGEKANTRVTQMLLSLGFVGIPWMYNANFSLVSRLLKRPEEDRQRLLSDWIILRPDFPLSEDWQLTLKAQKDVAPDLLTFDPIKDAPVIHTYTAGRKRATVRLLVLALRNEHSQNGTVDLAAIKRAYHSESYASYRLESEIISTQAVQNRPDKKRKDLWCPLPLNPDASVKFAEWAKEKRDEKVADEELKSSLNSNERESLKKIQHDMNKTKKTPGTVIPLKRKSTPTAEELKKNANWFKDQL